MRAHGGSARDDRDRPVPREWRKSSYSGQSGNCVEVARNLPGLVVVRDYQKPDGAKLAISRETWQVFLKGLRP